MGKLGRQEGVTAEGRCGGIDPRDFFLRPRYKMEFYLTCTGTRISSTVHTKAPKMCMTLGPIFQALRDVAPRLEVTSLLNAPSAFVFVVK